MQSNLLILNDTLLFLNKLLNFYFYFKIESSTSVQKSYKDRSKESSKSPASSSGYTKLYSGISSKSKSESSTKSSSSSPTVSSSKITPHIKILTPDKHAQNLKRKASKQGESKKKH